MVVTLAMSALLLTQSGSIAAIEEPQTAETTEVAYEELTDGKAAEAVRNLEALLLDNPGDPAILINLGSAYAEQGQLERAAGFYAQAAESDVRYRLELADGSWADSRLAARRALEQVEQRRLAMN